MKKSNLERIYNSKDRFDIINNKYYHFTSNPFYKVNNFITSFDSNLNKNLLVNLKDLVISDKPNFRHSAYYDHKKNEAYSKCDKFDIFVLLCIASNNRNRRYTGIITRDGLGYGLNNGLTEIYTNKMINKRLIYTIEALVSEFFLIKDKKIITESFFQNDGNRLISIDKDMELILSLLDNYHDNQLELMYLYKEKFTKERFYHNEVYGEALRQKNFYLNSIYNKISKLEYNNHAIIYKIIETILNIIEQNENKEEQLEQLNYLNKNFSKITNRDELSYLNDIKDIFQEKLDVTNVKVMKLVK